jgi:Ca2+-binding RTX toxin-like protein
VRDAARRAELPFEYVVETAADVARPDTKWTYHECNESLSSALALSALAVADGADTLVGGFGADVLLGGKGNDVVVGGGGNDRALLSDGEDRFQ